MYFKIKQLCLLLITGLVLSACSAEQKSKPQEVKIQKKINQKYQFKIHGCAINFNGTDLYMNDEIDRWTDILGKHSRIIDSYDGEDHTYIYIWDEIGIKLRIRKSDKAIESLSFALSNFKKFYSDNESTQTEFVKNTFKDAIKIDDLLIGAYPMDDEIREKFKAKTSVNYDKVARCTKDQTDGSVFFVAIGTSTEEPETINNILFYRNMEKLNLNRSNSNNKPAFCTDDNKDFSPQCK